MHLWINKNKKAITHLQCWASYSKNVIYYSLLVIKSNIVTYYFLATVISYITSYITFSSCLTEVVTVYLLTIWQKSTLDRGQKLLQTLNSDWK